MKKYEIINLLGKKFNFKSYLEISSLSTGYAYDKVDSSIFATKSGIYYIPDTDEIVSSETESLCSKDTDTLMHRTDIDIKPNRTNLYQQY